MKRLVLLDLDNTLIYSDYSAKLKVNKLFKYMDFLYVYERPYAKDLIQRCHEIGEVMIFTMSEWEYAIQISEHLDIRPTRIFYCDHCVIKEGAITKVLPDQFYQLYDEIIIIDDSPKIWDVRIPGPCRFMVPFMFTGDKNDDGLKLIMDRLSE